MKDSKVNGKSISLYENNEIPNTIKETTFYINISKSVNDLSYRDIIRAEINKERMNLLND